jgi:predicted ATP-dependent protease
MAEFRDFCAGLRSPYWPILPSIGVFRYSLDMKLESQFIGQSGAFLDAVERASRAAAMNRPVLVIGERGTGKELIAERLHRLSSRWDEPLDDELRSASGNPDRSRAVRTRGRCLHRRHQGARGPL